MTLEEDRLRLIWQLTVFQGPRHLLFLLSTVPTVELSIFGVNISQEEENMKKNMLLPLRKLPRSLLEHFCFPLLGQHFIGDVGDHSNSYLLGPHCEDQMN